MAKVEAEAAIRQLRRECESLLMLDFELGTKGTAHQHAKSDGIPESQKYESVRLALVELQREMRSFLGNSRPMEDETDEDEILSSSSASSSPSASSSLSSPRSVSHTSSLMHLGDSDDGSIDDDFDEDLEAEDAPIFDLNDAEYDDDDFIYFLIDDNASNPDPSTDLIRKESERIIRSLYRDNPSSHLFTTYENAAFSSYTEDSEEDQGEFGS